MNSPAERLATLFETPPNERKTLDEISKQIHQNGDLGASWRPWWPCVSEVWALQGRPNPKDNEETQTRYTQAWRALLDILDDYQAHKGMN